MITQSARWLLGLAGALTVATAHPAFAQTVSLLPQSGWTLVRVDSEETASGDYATNAFDGDPSTLWTSEWVYTSPTHPHEIVIDLASVHSIVGFQYLPRQDGQPYGRIAQYQFSVSPDGVTWGTAAAASTFPNTSTQQEVRFTARSGRYVRLRALSEVAGRPWTAVAELNVLVQGGSTTPGTPGRTPISQTNWTLRSVDSQETDATDNRAINAFDGNPNTIWASQWLYASPPPPHDLQINLGAVYDVDGFRYLPRQDGQPYGRIARYEFYVSMDGTNWGTAVASGTFQNSATEKEITFTAKTGRYVRLRGLSEVGGYPWSTVAELNVLGRWDGVDSGPQVTLTATTTGPYTAPASVSLRATAQDQDGFVTQVEFFSQAGMLRRDTSSPYTATVSNLGNGTHSFSAVAHDNGDNTGTSNTLTITVGGGGGGDDGPTRAVFTASSNHNQAVEYYVLEVFTQGSNPATASPVASQNLGKPGVVNGECNVDVSQLMANLSSGTYISTVTAVGPGGSARSAPSPSFQP
jgi:hypothetical protein